MLIQALNGEFIEIDVDDIEAVSGFNWRINNHGYAVYGDSGRTFLMHRVILAASGTQVVDHSSGVRSDNRRSNIRICTHTQNMQNRKRASHNRSGYKGVYRRRDTGKWCAEISANGRRYRLARGLATPEEAYELYCLAADLLRGRYSNHG